MDSANAYAGGRPPSAGRLLGSEMQREAGEQFAVGVFTRGACELVWEVSPAHFLNRASNEQIRSSFAAAERDILREIGNRCGQRRAAEGVDGRRPA
ncbi:MAG: hypothetical protein LBB38_04185 [Puniceicoccales bacterium]|jgi:hypothetical protein|nr:hypothetical protein [Puniceicoccales bacterium]